MSVVRFREFLNTLEDGGSAYVRFAVHYKRNAVHAYFTIRDCNQEATLEFSVSGSRSPANVLAKLEILKTAVTEFEQAHLAALKKHQKRLAIKKAKKAKVS